MDPESSLGKARRIAEFDVTDFPEREWPYNEKDLSKLDSADDAFFYMQPRFCTHIDDYAITSLTAFYGEVLREMAGSGSTKDGRAPCVLDVCSSWISHLPRGEDAPQLGRVAGIGMNSQELGRNDQLTDFAVKNLNEEPDLSMFEDGAFDLVVCCVSVDYLTRPLEVFKEFNRVLAPGGKCIMSFSNRMFYSKAVRMWLEADDIGRLGIVGSYYHYSKGWTGIEAYDLMPGLFAMEEREGSSDEQSQGFVQNFAGALGRFLGISGGGEGDPMYAVVATKVDA